MRSVFFLDIWKNAYKLKEIRQFYFEFGSLKESVKVFEAIG